MTRVDHDNGTWTWRLGAHELTMRQTGRFDERGQSVLGYVLTTDGEIIFSGEDFAGSPLHADDSPQTMLALIGFLALRPGDTDRDYFDNHTPEQFRWLDAYADSVMSEAMDVAIRHIVPSVEEVAEELRGTLESADYIAAGELEEGFDVRLQVLAGGCWGIHWGDPGFDLDHSGYWGAAMLGSGDDLEEIAEELIQQVVDAMNNGGM